MLVYRTIAKSFGNLTRIIMQNLRDILLLFCTPTCPPHHVSATQELLAFVNIIKCILKGSAQVETAVITR